MDKFISTHRHYKGGLYQLLGYGIHTETNEQLAFYRNEKLELFARPKEMFDDYVIGHKLKGKHYPVFRFELIGCNHSKVEEAGLGVILCCTCNLQGVPVVYDDGPQTIEWNDGSREILTDEQYQEKFKED